MFFSAFGNKCGVFLLDKNTKICYNYDTLSRVTERTVKNATTNAVISTETFTYDAAGNITGGSADDTFVYDNNNRLTNYNRSAVTYNKTNPRVK